LTKDGCLRRSNRNAWSGFRREVNEDAWQLHLMRSGLWVVLPALQRRPLIHIEHHCRSLQCAYLIRHDSLFQPGTVHRDRLS
jgi:hypothetical protein